MSLTIQQAQAYAAQAGFTNATVPGTNATQIQTITAIMLKENGLNIPGPNPVNAFHDAYTNFALNSGFNAFPSYKTGSYKSSLDVASLGSNALATTVNTSVTELFQKAGFAQWWNQPHHNYFGENNEKGQDYGPLGGFNSPVGAIMGGKVVMSSTLNEVPPNGGCGGAGNNSVGWVVQIMTQSDGLHHYQHLRASTVKKGDIIGAGDQVGISGGCPEGYYGTGNGCTCNDGWSDGGHIEVRWAPTAKNAGWTQGWEDPKQHFIDLSKLPAVGMPLLNINTGNGSASQFMTQLSDKLKNTVQLGPDPSVAYFLRSFDVAFSVRNPFDFAAFGEADTGINIFQWAINAGANIFYDMSAMVVRTFIVFTGILICWKVLGATVVGQTASNVAQTGLNVGIAAASVV